MTFNPAEFRFWYRDFPAFFQWAMRRDVLFPPKEIADDGNSAYDLTSKMYVLMKRLGQSYETIMNMPAEERDKIFEMEIQLMEEEAKQAKEKNNG